MDAKHTATPSFTELRTEVSSSGMRALRDVAGHQVGSVISSADAEFIVRACNAHDDLVKALRGLLDSLRLSQIDHPRINPAARAAIAALSKAGDAT